MSERYRGDARGQWVARYNVAGDRITIEISPDVSKEDVTISLLAAAPSLGGKISRLTLLGAPGELAFTQDAAGLHLKLPATAPCRYAYALKIVGLKTNPSTATPSGNPS